MRITPTSGLTPDEIERFINEATNFAETDREAKQRVMLHNKLESLLRNTKKSFEKFGGLLSENDQDIAERVVKESETAVKTGTPEEIDKAINALERIAGQLTVAMMKPTGDSATHKVEDSK